MGIGEGNGFVLDDSRLEQPEVYTSPEGRPCAPYVPVYDGASGEVGAIIKGHRFGMAGVLELDHEALVADGVVVPANVASKMHAHAAEAERGAQ